MERYGKTMKIVVQRVAFYCSACGSPLKAAATMRGKSVRCPHCSRQAAVPEQPVQQDEALASVDPSNSRILSVEIKFLCPACESKLAADARRGGAKVPCPRCGREIVVPGLPGGMPAALPPRPDASLPDAASRDESASVLSEEEVRFLTAVT